MKLWMKLALTGVVAFVSGFAAGYFVRKKTGEVQIEEITEEELQKLAKEASQAEGKPEETENTDIVEPVPQDEKEAYFKRWKTDAELQEQYDTRSKDSPDDVVVTDEDIEAIEEHLDKIKDIEAGTMQDWLHWLSQPEGEYDTVELKWYEKDDVVCDDEGNPLENSEKHMGFDISEQFMLVDPELTGDDDVRVIFNHKTHSLYYITRVSGLSYSQHKRLEDLGIGPDEDDE